MHQIDFTVPKLNTKPVSLSRADQAMIAADALGDTKSSLLVRIVAKADEVSVREIFQHTRCRAPIAATRQLAMYMMHVVIGRTLTEVGKFFGRDRTTVAYACARIEDMRDDEVLDLKIEHLEDQFLCLQHKKLDFTVSKIGQPVND